MEQRLGRDFFARPALEVAPDLLGRRLVRETSEGRTSGIVVETEAYGGVNDPASHAYGGRRTRRNEVMWGPPGHAYVYPVYGMYLCFNVVAGEVGSPEGVFLRAAEPREGLELMARRRGMELSERNVRQLANGPSKLCIAFGIDRSLNGEDVLGDALHFTTGEEVTGIAVSRRIGIDYAGEGIGYPWRFLVQGNRFISRPP